jgi:protocatechuate 3,4-dioxygenase, beta subunit
MYFKRRKLIVTTGIILFTGPSTAYSLRTPWQSAGPFYPDVKPYYIDNNLVNIGLNGIDADGKKLDIQGNISNSSGKPIEDMQIEIWQTDNNGVYINSNAPNQSKRDPNFQGFGKSVSNLKGDFEFKTILPVAYFGRPPHIHLLVKNKDQIKLVTQFYFENHPLNESDFLFRKMNLNEKKSNTLSLYKYSSKENFTSQLKIIL